MKCLFMIGKFSLGVLICILIVLPAGAIELDVYTEELPPLNMMDPASGQPIGFSVEIVKILLEETGIQVADGKIKVFPWARAYWMAKNEKNVMLFSMTRTKARDALFKWVGPLAPRTVWLWKMKSRKDVIVNRLEDARSYVIGGVIGFAVSEHLEKQGFNVHKTTSIDSNWRMLFHNRIDLGTAMELETAYSIKKYGRRYEELERLVIVDDSSQFYIALSQQTDNEVQSQLQSALDRIKSDGRYQAVWNQYLN